MRLRSISALAGLVIASASAVAALPQYAIYDIGIVNTSDAGSQAFRVSDNGIATGRSLGNPSTAYTYTVAGGRVALPNLASPARNFSVGNGVNEAGTVVGTGATTTFGSNPLPLIWKNGTVAQLPLPSGQTVGRANDINDSEVAVGSVNGGSLEAPVIYSGANATLITTVAANGTVMRTAFSINDAGLIAGTGIDPANAARNVGMVYNPTTGTMLDIGSLPTGNGALAFDISNAGHVVGSAMQNQGSGTPFIWTEAGGMVAVPLPAGTSQGSLRGVNSDGWAVGTASNAFAIPFLYDGTQSVTIQSLVPVGSGWDLSMNTSSSAMGISEDGIIVGTGVFNGKTRGYMLVPIVPEPTSLAALAATALLTRRRRD
jgi:uncharacterized membrane protein